MSLPLAEIERRAAMTAWRSARTAENRAWALRANLRLLDVVGGAESYAERRIGVQSLLPCIRASGRSQWR